MAGGECISKVQLHIACEGLKDKDVLSKSDPICVVYIWDENAKKWMEYARTEKIKNNLNPKFTKPINIDYHFEIIQKLLFSVFDIDNETSQLDDDDFLGQMECNLGQIVSNVRYTQPLKQKSGRQHGKITVTAEEVSKSNDKVELIMRAQKLDKKDFLGKSDPYLLISRQISDGSFVSVHKTKVIKNTLNPAWPPFEVSVNTLCNGDYTKPIKIDCYDWDSDSNDDLIGSFTTTFNEMLKANEREVSWPCINPKKQKKKRDYSNSGIVYLSRCKVTHYYSFIDYVMGGCQINFTVGIDFTASNGHPAQPTSLHYINPYQPNEYMKALTAVGEICQDYDSDKLFPAFGFGAKLPPEMQVSHQFALNFNPSNPYCQGIPGVVAAYQNAISQVHLYGPTNVSPIINHVSMFASKAAQENKPSNYFVLLLLTDGVLSDMSLTIDAIVKASHYPLSIIIVGVGSADFTDMNTLDSDDGRLRSRSGVAARDIVQFVPFRDFANKPPWALAQAVLAEIPNQVSEYFTMKKMAPGSRPSMGQ
ncbi:copine-3-like [Xenia sp. Carnegie-2017]|uniref:copine-3-like n=1 Tax=Xenia sp. Carnegie-2017 TaxID=2897299 RepID=UPI001F04118C|nr:copine-3-like [Xenia sp. Carnegie-2017]